MKSVLATGMIALLALGLTPSGVSGHARLMNPPGRSSAWRFGFDTPVNYNDNELFCGGYDVQYHQNGGKCGVCGDPYDKPRPRENEAGGLYGTGILTANYTMNQEITVDVDLTANHRGHFEFRLCPNNAPEKYIEQECLDQYRLELADGSGVDFPINHDELGMEYITLKLPQGLKCSQCVLQWHYQTGNSWGDCGDGTGAIGCGDQEVFRACADIGIW
ncbi:uncharacterized protein LOC143026409 [Oratosquilla oratoria]|uniref:uncharacterized protein LOC143026409 n=1 Tax=Oratosquilla oratoria TaxID=337810 RepID=UPI003F772756